VVELDVWHFYSVGAGKQPLFEEWTKEFEKAHPNIKVKWTWGGSEFMTPLRARFAAGKPPDMFPHNSANTHILAREGEIPMKLDKYLEGMNYEGDTKWKDTFLPGVIARAWVPDAADGPGYYGIPYETYVVGIFYNKDIFEKHNIEIPKTWSEFLDVCETLKKAGIEPLSADGNISFYNAWWFHWLSTRICGADVLYNTALNKPGTSWKDEPCFLEVARKARELVDKGYFMEGYEGSVWPAAQVDWVNGRTAMILMGSWLPSEMLAETPEGFRMDLFPFPIVEGGKGDPTTIEMKFNGWIIPKGAKHPEEAILFAKWFTSRWFQERMAKEGLAPAAIKGVPVPESQSGAVPMLAKAKKVIEFYGGLSGDAPEWLSKVLYPLWDLLFFGEISPEEFIERLQKAHDEFYAAK